MKSQLRIQLETWLEQIALDLNLKDKKILEIGIGGDDKPSGSYKFFGKGNQWKTMDVQSEWKPDIVADICNSGLPDNSFDLIIMTQTIEHIWDYRKAIKEVCRITKEYAIIDSPWMYSFHSDPRRSYKNKMEWDDWHRISPSGLYRACREAGFKKVKIFISNHLNLALCRKS